MLQHDGQYADAHLSPDGRWLFYVAQEIREDEYERWVWWLMDIQNNRHHDLNLVESGNRHPYLYPLPRLQVDWLLDENQVIIQDIIESRASNAYLITLTEQQPKVSVLHHIQPWSKWHELVPAAYARVQYNPAHTHVVIHTSNVSSLLWNADTEELTEVALIYQNPLVNTTWLDNNTLRIASFGQVYEYNVAEDVRTPLIDPSDNCYEAELTDSHFVTALSEDGKWVYGIHENRVYEHELPDPITQQ